MLSHQLKRWLYLTHRWIGIVTCLLFAMCHGTGTRSPRASLALATPEPAGAWAAMTALESGAHVDALALIDELVALGSRRGRWWQRVAGPRDEDMSRV